MIVKELIEILEQLDPNQEIMYDGDYRNVEVDEVVQRDGFYLIT